MSRLSPAHIASVLQVVLIASMASYAQGSHTLQGKVVLPNGATPPNPVRVSLTFNGMSVYETFTDLSGRFSFTGLRRGMYQLTAEGDDRTFETTRVSAEVVAYGSAPQTFTQNIQLRIKASKGVPPADVASVDALDPATPALAREQYQKGLKQARDNNAEKAVKYFQEAINAYPKFYSAHVAIAEQYAKLKRDTDAAASYQKAIEIKPDRAPAYVGLGVMLVKQKKYNEAVSPLRRSLELDKQASAPYLFLGLAEMMTGDYESAETSLLRSYEIGKPALAHMYLANLYELKGEPEKAIQQLKAFLDESPNLADERRAEIAQVIDKLRKRENRKK